MTIRLLAFLSSLLLGGAAGWFLGGDLGAALGLVAGAVGWFAFETVRAARALHWLRKLDVQAAPKLGGMWGEAVDRARRALVAREKRTAEAERRLEEFLDAIRGSPNGVILLDPQGRIEWCNDTAAAQFGLDPERDHLQHIVHVLRNPEFGA